MSDWDSELYLKFKRQRTQPAIDLAQRVRPFAPRRIADLGCGPGNSTAVLRSFFADADITGVDNSQNMIEKATAEHPDLSFRLCDVHALDGGYDLLFSNACLQWIPNHRALLPELMGKLNAGGALAVQIPINGDEPLYRIIAETTAEEKWGFRSVKLEANETLTPEEYLNILSSCSRDFDLWETVYYHALPSHQALLDWVKGTRLRPYLDALNAEKAAAFEREILERTRRAYSVMADGSVILRFRRLFFVAEK